MKVSKEQFVNSAGWKIIGDFSVKGITFLVSIILMRILSPEDYGLIALTNVFTSLSDLLVEGGFSTALIRKEKVDSKDYGSVLSISLGIAAFLYLIIFFISPFVSNYYGEPLLKPVLRVVGLTLFLQSIVCVRTAIVNRQMQFRLLSLCNTVGSVISGIIGIICALMGLGVWALVIQRLSQMIVSNALLFLKVKVKIDFTIEINRIKEIFKFSIGVVGSSVINYLSGSIYNFVIGKRYSVQELGYYDKGSQLPMQLSLYTFGSMSSVLLPTLASYQNDKSRIKEICRKIVRMTSFIIFPMMIGLLLIAHEITILLFTEKWLPSVPLMKSFCIYYLATPFMLINVQVFFALGHSFLRVKTELLRMVLMIISLITVIFVLKLGVNELAISMALVAILSSIITFHETKQLIGYLWKEVMKDMAKPIIATTIMSVVIILVNSLAFYFGIVNRLGLITMLIKISIGISSYILIVKIMRLQEYNEIKIALVKFVKVKRK